MSDVDITQLRKLIDEAITQWVAGGSADVSPEPTAAVADKPERTDGKRAVRTKSTGDRVYLLYKDENGIDRKSWVAGTQLKPGPELLKELGFEMTDVEDVDDKELIPYQMGPSIFKAD